MELMLPPSKGATGWLRLETRRPRGDPERLRGLFVRWRAGTAGFKKNLQCFEQRRPALGRILLGESRHCPAEQGQRPASVEDFLRAQSVRRLQPIAVLGVFQIERDKLVVTAPLVAMATFSLGAKVVFERSKQK